MKKQEGASADIYLSFLIIYFQFLWYIHIFIQCPSVITEIIQFYTTHIHF